MGLLQKASLVSDTTCPGEVATVAMAVARDDVNSTHDIRELESESAKLFTEEERDESLLELLFKLREVFNPS